MNKKKILLISNMYPSKNDKHYGIFVKNVELLLKDNGYVVDKVVMYKTKNKFIKLIKYILFHLKVIFKGLFHKYDFLYVHFVSHSSLGAVIVKKMKRNVKLILNCHGNDVVPDLEIDFKNIKRSKKYLKYADKIIVPSNYFKDIIKNNYQISKEKLFVYPSGGVDTKKFIRKNANYEKNIKYIGYVSRIEKDKGWDIYLKMIKELEKRGKAAKYKFLLVGNGQEEKQMNKLIDELNIRKYLDIKKMISQENLIDLYNSLDIFVFPTKRKSDSLGLVGLEAMSCEVLTITSDQYGPTEYIKNGVNGLTFTCNDYLDLTDKILEVEKLTELEKNNLRKNARITALEYDINNTKEKILEVFQ